MQEFEVLNELYQKGQLKEVGSKVTIADKVTAEKLVRRGYVKEYKGDKQTKEDKTK